MFEKTRLLRYYTGFYDDGGRFQNFRGKCPLCYCWSQVISLLILLREINTLFLLNLSVSNDPRRKYSYVEYCHPIKSLYVFTIFLHVRSFLKNKSLCVHIRFYNTCSFIRYRSVWFFINSWLPRTNKDRASFHYPTPTLGIYLSHIQSDTRWKTEPTTQMSMSKNNDTKCSLYK